MASEPQPIRYLTITELEVQKDPRLVAQLSSDNNSIVRNDTNVLAAIAGASDIVNAKLRFRKAIPLSPVDETIKGITADLAMGQLSRGRDKDLVDAAKAALTMLDDIAAGRMQIAAPDVFKGTVYSEPPRFGNPRRGGHRD